VQVGSADSAIAHFQNEIGCPAFRGVDVLDDEGLAHFLEYGCAHVHHFSCQCPDWLTVLQASDIANR
jgi:hypothetical protein